MSEKSVKLQIKKWIINNSIAILALVIALFSLWTNFPPEIIYKKIENKLEEYEVQYVTTSIQLKKKGISIKPAENIIIVLSKFHPNITPMVWIRTGIECEAIVLNPGVLRLRIKRLPSRLPVPIRISIRRFLENVTTPLGEPISAGDLYIDGEEDKDEVISDEGSAKCDKKPMEIIPCPMERVAVK